MIKITYGRNMFYWIITPNEESKNGKEGMTARTITRKSLTIFSTTDRK